jgi:hypothetical protein
VVGLNHFCVWEVLTKLWSLNFILTEESTCENLCPASLGQRLPDAAMTLLTCPSRQLYDGLELTSHMAGSYEGK